MSNRYILTYTFIMAMITAVVLAFVVNVLHPRQVANEAVFNKREILSSIEDEIGTDLDKLTDTAVLSLFKDKVDQIVIDANGNVVDSIQAEDVDMAAEEKKPAAKRLYPLFIYNGKEGKIYLMSVRGNGLWDKIWGHVALKNDFNTVVGTSFGHIGETPGLGAEIKDNPNFAKQFQGKKIYEDGKYVSVAAVKGGIKDPAHQVDAVSGATITSNGVSQMLYKGIAIYLPYFKGLKKEM